MIIIIVTYEENAVTYTERREIKKKKKMNYTCKNTTYVIMIFDKLLNNTSTTSLV